MLQDRAAAVGVDEGAQVPVGVVLQAQAHAFGVGDLGQEVVPPHHGRDPAHGVGDGRGVAVLALVGEQGRRLGGPGGSVFGGSAPLGAAGGSGRRHRQARQPVGVVPLPVGAQPPGRQGGGAPAALVVLADGYAEV